ncbi:hypothetical protein P3G55_10730, partial [Leptospira sp. 96542]|nr:hypothetical protein [Leptospira sp. 96542]
KGFIDKGYADHKTRESNRKAQGAAIEQVAVMVATTAITMGAGAALNAMVASANSTISAIGTAVANFGNSVGNAVGSLLGSTAQATTTMVTNASTGLLEVSKTAITAVSSMANAVVQGAYGARNGIEGALAGITNGLLGGITQLAGPIDSGLLKGITPGLGVTYHPDDGWGGMIGLGNATMNASVSFSQRGNTTVQGTYALTENVQFNADVTTNGAMNMGFDLNDGGGDLKDWNLSFNYDLAGGGLSASLGYTDPDSTFGLTSTIDRNGLSTSAELTGVSIATNGPNGFQMDEINFAEQNINAAQDKTQKDQDDARLIASGSYTADDVAKMKDDDRQKALEDLNAKNPTPAPEPGSLAAFLGSIGNFVGDVMTPIAGIAIGGLGMLAGLAGMPTSPVRRKEDEVTGEAPPPPDAPEAPMPTPEMAASPGVEDKNTESPEAMGNSEVNRSEDDEIKNLLNKEREPGLASVKEFTNEFGDLSNKDKLALYRENLTKSGDFQPVEGAPDVTISVVEKPASKELVTEPNKIFLIDSFKKAIEKSGLSYLAQTDTTLNHPLTNDIEKKLTTQLQLNEKLKTEKSTHQDAIDYNRAAIENYANLYNSAADKKYVQERILELSKEITRLDNELKGVDTRLKGVESALIKLSIENRQYAEKNAALLAAKGLLENKTVNHSLDPNFREAVEKVVAAENRYYDLLTKNQDSESDGKLHPSTEAIKAKAELDKALKGMDKYQDVLQKINTGLSDPNQGLASVVDSIAKITTKDPVLALVKTVPEVKRYLRFQVYQNPITGEIRFGSGMDPTGFTVNSAPGGQFYQGDTKNPSLAMDLANEIKKLPGVDPNVTPEKIMTSWCQAVSLWSTLRSEFGDAVEPNFLDFAKKNIENGNILVEPGNVMFVKANDTIMNAYGKDFGKEWHRDTFKETNPDITRDQAYAEIAEAMQTTTSNSVMVRISGTHTISLHRDGSGDWIVNDTGHPEINGTKVDPNHIENSTLFTKETYRLETPKSIAFPVFSNK